MLEEEIAVFKRCAEESVDEANRLSGDSFLWRVRLMAAASALEDALEQEVAAYNASAKNAPWHKMTEFREDPYLFEEGLRNWLSYNRDGGVPPLDWDYFVEYEKTTPSHINFTWYGIRDISKYRIIFDGEGGSLAFSEVYDPDSDQMLVKEDPELTEMYHDAEEWLKTERLTRQLIKDMFPVEDEPEY